MSLGLDRSLIRAVLFDIDGTLADTDQVVVLRLARLLRPIAPLLRGHDPSAAARRLVMASETPGNALVTLVDRLGLDEAAAPLIDLLHRLRGLGSPRHFVLVPGVAELLHALVPHFALGIVTSRDHRSAVGFLEQYALGPLFRCVVSARTCRRLKPHPAPVRLAAELLGVSPLVCLVVGDTAVDILAARAADAQSVGVLGGFGERAELERAGADLILETTSDLLAVLLPGRS